MAQQSFSATIDAWVAATKERSTAVVRSSAQKLVDEVTLPVAEGGNMRVVTGFLRASITASTTSMPAIRANAIPPKGSAPNSFAIDLDAISLVIANAKLGETIYLGFIAAYARPREYRDGFVRLAAQRWPQIVAEEAKRIRSRVESR